MNTIEFNKKYQFANLLENLSKKYISQFLTKNPDLKIIGFGVDGNSATADILICILTEEGIKDVPNWLKNWEWIGEWDYWNINEGFDEEDSYQKIRTKIDELSFSEKTEDFNEIKKEMLSSICKIFIKLQGEYPELENTTLIIRDHGDTQDESTNRLENILNTL